MLKIGTFSKLSRISVRMLRYYEEMGLLAPNEVDTATGYRYYGEGQLMEAERIRALREMGFGIGAVREILSACHDPAALEQLLRIRREELCGEIQAAKQRLLLLETTLKRVGKDGIVENYNVTVKEIPGRYAASLRKSIPDYAREGELWGQMMEETAPPAHPDGGALLEHGNLPRQGVPGGKRGCGDPDGGKREVHRHPPCPLFGAAPSAGGCRYLQGLLPADGRGEPGPVQLDCRQRVRDGWADV